MNISTFAIGLAMSLSLIVAIGAQNAFVLRQGLRNQHVFVVCLTCALSDAVLITLGVTSFREIAAWLPWIDPVMRYGGAAFLIWYGAKSLRSAVRSSGSLAVNETAIASMRTTLLTCLAFTWLNPHVYLDTVVLLGTISTRFPNEEAAFGAGAATGSFLFFFALGYAATFMRPLFARPSAWRILEAVIGFTMWVIAFNLLVRT